MISVHATSRYLAVLPSLAVATTAAALLVELTDANGTRYHADTDVTPFSVQMRGDFRTQLATCGLTDATVSDVAVAVPFTVSAVATYAIDQPFTYDATAGKSGTAKNS